jgi:hypothetical protein
MDRMYTLVSSGLKLRFALWAIEQALPDDSSLMSRVKSGLWGIGLAVAGGMLVALTVAILLVAAGWWLHTEAAFAPWESVLIIVAILAVSITAFAVASQRKFKKALRKRARTSTADEDPLKALFNGFIEGLVADKPATAKRAEKREKKAAYPKAA